MNFNPNWNTSCSSTSKSIARKKISGAEVFSAPSRFVIDPALLRGGDNDIRIVRQSDKSPVYFAANATFLPRLQEPVTAVGNRNLCRGANMPNSSGGPRC